MSKRDDKMFRRSSRSEQVECLWANTKSSRDRLGVLEDDIQHLKLQLEQAYQRIERIVDIGAHLEREQVDFHNRLTALEQPTTGKAEGNSEEETKARYPEMSLEHIRAMRKEPDEKYKNYQEWSIRSLMNELATIGAGLSGHKIPDIWHEIERRLDERQVATATNPRHIAFMSAVMKCPVRVSDSPSNAFRLASDLARQKGFEYTEAWLLSLADALDQPADPASTKGCYGEEHGL